MQPLSPDLTSQPRKNLTAIMSRLAVVGQEPIAKAIKRDVSTISKMQSEGRIGQFATFLAALELKVVNTKYRCVDPKTLETILHGHRMWVASIESHEQLMWD